MDTTKAYRVLGLSDHDTCEVCGRQDLRRTVLFEGVESCEQFYAGTTCAEYIQLQVLADGEAKPRAAREILTLAKRADLAREVAAIRNDIELRAAIACSFVVDHARERRGMFYEREVVMPYRWNGVEMTAPHPARSPSAWVEWSRLNPFDPALCDSIAARLARAEKKSLPRRKALFAEVSAYLDRQIRRIEERLS